jgi:RNA polymerase sigma-70 factor (ECF subfamily)
MRTTAIACGATEREADDVVATCLLRAWTAIQRGGFRLLPWVDPAEALRRWLYGIVWRLSRHERERARHHREVLTPDPWALVRRVSPEDAVIDPERRLLARDALRVFARMPKAQRKLMLGAAEGWSAMELALVLGVSVRTVQLRLDRGRTDLMRALEGEDRAAAEGDRPRRGAARPGSGVRRPPV